MNESFVLSFFIAKMPRGILGEMAEKWYHSFQCIVFFQNWLLLYKPSLKISPLKLDRKIVIMEYTFQNVVCIQATSMHVRTHEPHGLQFCLLEIRVNATFHSGFVEKMMFVDGPTQFLAFCQKGRCSFYFSQSGI